MATYSIRPLPDGVNQRGSWQVQRNGRRISTHVKKSAAKRKARREAGRGDSIVNYGSNGQNLGTL